MASLLRDAAQSGIANRAGLLINFLEHEMLEAALFRQDRIPGHMLDLPPHRPSVEVRKMHAVGRDHGHIAVRQKENVARMMQNCRHIRSDEILVVAQSNHRRRPVARRHNLVGLVARNHRQRENSGQLLHRLPHRIFQRRAAVPFELDGIFLDQMRNDFGIGLGGEVVAFFDQLLFQAEIVLDDPVVHDHDLAGAVAMGMRVFFRGTSVRGPARVPNAIGAVNRILPDHFFQIAQLALGAPQLQPFSVAADRDARRIVAAILQPAQSLDNDGNDTLLTDVADNATHTGPRIEKPQRISRPGLLESSTRPGRLGQGETELFNYGIGQHFAGDALHFGLRLFGATVPRPA